MTNTVKRVVRYVADDGTEHETHAAARKHNATYALEAWLAGWLYAAGVESPATVANGLAPALRKDWNISKRKEKKS